MKRISLHASTLTESKNYMDEKGYMTEDYSLASSYLISAHDPLMTFCDDPSTHTLEYSWSLYELGSLQPVYLLNNAHKLIKGIEVDERIKLCYNIKCKVGIGQSSEDWIIEVDSSSLAKENKDKSDESLLQTISKIMVQRNIEKILKMNRKSILKINIQTSESFLQYKLDIDNSVSTKDAINLLFSINDNDNIELVEMVNSNGNALGSLPRSIVHQYNILHRGIGILPIRYPSSPDKNDFDIYVHQRTSTKRIFPSLYDMFVGGVSGMDENVQLTALRELEEELGLSRIDALSKPLFKCIVCTSYNRCVVTCFRYVFDDNLDNIQWQKEEVAWGKYVPYRIVRDAAALSVNRLIHQNKWPGGDNDLWDDIKKSNEASEQDKPQWKTWDFVPDGLLVWEAWEDWSKKEDV